MSLSNIAGMAMVVVPMLAAMAWFAMQMDVLTVAISLAAALVLSGWLIFAAFLISR